MSRTCGTPESRSRRNRWDAESRRIGFVDRQVVTPLINQSQRLPDDGRLAGLAWAEQRDDEIGRLGQATDERGNLIALERGHPFEFTPLSGITQ